MAVTSEDDSKKHYEEVINGQFQVIYIGPEMLLGTKKWRSMLESDRYQTCVCAVIIDEAHCVKKWLVNLQINLYVGANYMYRGDDFRELFKRIGELRAILPSTVNMMAVTACNCY